MHEMDKTPRILTIIGLILEGLGVLGSIFAYYLLTNIQDFPGFSAEMMDMSESEYQDMIELFAWLANLIGVVAIVLAVFFVISLVLFSKLLSGKFTEEQAKKVYLYQAIWGGINLISNQILGILYLVSGVGGYNGHREERDIRNGI